VRAVGIHAFFLCGLILALGLSFLPFALGQEINKCIEILFFIVMVGLILSLNFSFTGQQDVAWQDFLDF
jgi:hypothetical protein